MAISRIGTGSYFPALQTAAGLANDIFHAIHYGGRSIVGMSQHLFDSDPCPGFL